MNGLERLEILYHVFNQDRIEPFKFQYKMLPETGLKTKDFIAPTSFNFSKNQTFLMGRTMGSVSYLQILAPELTDRMLADFWMWMTASMSTFISSPLIRVQQSR